MASSPTKPLWDSDSEISTLLLCSSAAQPVGHNLAQFSIVNDVVLLRVSVLGLALERVSMTVDETPAFPATCHLKPNTSIIRRKDSLWSTSLNLINELAMCSGMFQTYVLESAQTFALAVHPSREP